MSPIIVKDPRTAQKVVYKGDARDRSGQIAFPGSLEVVPQLQVRLWSLYETARQKLN